MHHSHGVRQFHIISRGFRTKRSDEFTGLGVSTSFPSSTDSEKPETESFLNFLRSKVSESGSGQSRSPNAFERTADRTPTRVALGSIFDADQSAKRARRASKEAPKSTSTSTSTASPISEQDERLLRALQTGFELGHQQSAKAPGLFGSLAANERGKRSPFATVVGVTLRILNGFVNGIFLVLGVWLIYSVYKVGELFIENLPSHRAFDY